MSLTKLLREFHNGAIPTERDFAECLELAQAEVDRIGELIDSLPVYDQRVVARVDQSPVLSRFSSVDALVNWLYGEMTK